MNISQLVITDNLHDPYLIIFALHKFFFVLSFITYLFEDTDLSFLIFCGILFFSFTFFGLIVLDRMPSRRAFVAMAYILGCSMLVAAIFVGGYFALQEFTEV